MQGTRGALYILVTTASAMLLTRGEVDAAPRRTTMHCEEWRDYLYNVETGQFIEWVGEPYQVCRTYDEPVSTPESPDPDRYGGGIPYTEPPDPQEQCKRCEERYTTCIAELDPGTGRCIQHYRRVYHAWCQSSGRKRYGRPITQSYSCDTIRDPRGKPRRQCFGAGIDECIESYATDAPNTTTSGTGNVSVDITQWFPMAGGVKSERTMSWPGGTGFMTICEGATVEAGRLCETTRAVCTKAAGGCDG